MITETSEMVKDFVEKNGLSLKLAAYLLQVSKFRVWLYLCGLSQPNEERDSRVRRNIERTQFLPLISRLGIGKN